MPVRPVAPRRVRRVVRASSSARSLVLALALAALGAGALLPGCIFSPAPGPGPRPPDPLPIPATPKGAIDRLQRSYERLDLTDYTGLLTADFRYTFSSQTDPRLVSLYGDSWGKDDESESARHLFTGFVDSNGDKQTAANLITAQFVGDEYFSDFAHGDSAAWYQRCSVVDVNLQIEIPQGAGSATVYDIHARHDFYLVRGDAAVLDAGQTADSTRWYVRRWDDLSAPSTGAATPAAPVAEATWGGVRGSYDR